MDCFKNRFTPITLYKQFDTKKAFKLSIKALSDQFIHVYSTANVWVMERCIRKQLLLKHTTHSLAHTHIHQLCRYRLLLLVAATSTDYFPWVETRSFCSQVNYWLYRPNGELLRGEQTAAVNCLDSKTRTFRECALRVQVPVKGCSKVPKLGRSPQNTHKATTMATSLMQFKSH